MSLQLYKRWDRPPSSDRLRGRVDSWFQCPAYPDKLDVEWTQCPAAQQVSDLGAEENHGEERERQRIHRWRSADE